MTTATERKLQLLARQSQLLQELQSIGAELLQLELETQKPQPEPQPLLSSGEERALKRQQVQAKAKAAGTTPATVRKVEKAKAETKPETTNIDDMDSAAMKRLAKELGVDFATVKFNSRSQREAFRSTLKQAVVKHEARTWEGLSPSRQAQLTKMSAIPEHRLRQGAVFLKY